MDELYRYRAHVEAAVAERLPRLKNSDFQRLKPIIELGINHEQQHLELVFTDIKHAFAQNPLRPAYRSRHAPRADRPLATASSSLGERPAVGTQSVPLAVFWQALPAGHVAVSPMQLGRHTL